MLLLLVKAILNFGDQIIYQGVFPCTCAGVRFVVRKMIKIGKVSKIKVLTEIKTSCNSWPLF